MDLGLAGHAVIVAGGTRGIGRACVVRFLDEGCVVTAIGRRHETVERLLADVGAGDRLHGIAADLSEPGQARRCVAEAVATHGGLDCLVNAAGAAPAAKLDDDDVDWGGIFGKFAAYLAMIQAAVPHLVRRGGGAIVNLGGSEGVRPLPWSLPSVANNSSIIAVSRAIAQQLAPAGVRVNTINPGPTDTDRWDSLVGQWAELWQDTPERVAERLLATMPSGRLIDADQIAALVVFLASGLAGNVVGESLTADGLQRRDDLAVDPMRHHQSAGA
jgi:NAD(P)-dependent dehydrogenase (short-subunit alcohol dehydrogenase family)